MPICDIINGSKELVCVLQRILNKHIFSLWTIFFGVLHVKGYNKPERERAELTGQKFVLGPERAY